MKKIFTSMLAMAAVFCASATPSLVSVDPAEGSSISDRSKCTVTFEFSEAVTATTVQYLGGARFNPTISEGTINMAAPSKFVKVEVPAEAWGDPASGEYLLNVTLTTIKDAAGKQIMVTEKDEDGVEYSYPYTVSSNYTSPSISNAKYIGLDPDPATTTVWDVYSEGWGFVNFLFDEEVSLAATAQGIVTCYLNDGSDITFEISHDDLWADWDFWTGAYAITVPMMPDASITQENLTRIEVELYDVMIGGTEQEFDATYDLVSAPQRIAERNNTASSKLTLSEESSNVVYDIHGRVVMNTANQNIKDLPAGIYVMGGKKFIVR